MTVCITLLGQLVLLTSEHAYSYFSLVHRTPCSPLCLSVARPSRRENGEDVLSKLLPGSFTNTQSQLERLIV